MGWQRARSSLLNAEFVALQLSPETQNLTEPLRSNTSHMKQKLLLASLIATGLIGSAAMAQTSAAAPSASTAPAGPAKIAIIMFQAAVAQTNEGKRDFAEIETKYQPKQTQLKTQSDEINTLKTQLQAQSATLSDVERANRLKTIDDKEKSLQRDGEDAQNDFQQEIQQTYATLAQKVDASLQQVAKQDGYTLVLDVSQQQSPVLYATPNTDITEAVIAAYNTKSGIAAPPPSAPTPASRSTTPARRTPTASH
jgi:outer membrane protein